jgi:DNA transformation protein and related proteins
MMCRRRAQVWPFSDVESMPKRSEFVEHVVETMRRFGPVEAKSMFGGWGLYHQGVFFALIAGDALYIKADDESRADFEALGLEPFVYSMKDGQTLAMSYRAAPEEALESPDVMAEWARRGYAAALRAAARKRPAKRKPRIRKA